VIGTTVCWLVAAYFGPQTNRQTLIDFYKKVHPLGPGWRPIRIAAGVSQAEAAAFAGYDNVPLSLVGWVTGSLLVWSSLFTVGNFLYGRTGYALALGAVAAVSGVTVIWVVRRLWK
jgi:SSS family solute:Na+ symporter